MTRRCVSAWLLPLCVLAVVFSTANATDIPSLLGDGLAIKPLSNLANYFVGADKLGGKYAAVGLLLGAPILSGRYSGGDGMSLRKSGTLRDAISSKLDSLFDPLLQVDPFKFDPLGTPTKAGSLFQSTIGTALTAGSDLVSSKLQLKLDSLTAGLGLATRVGDGIDSAIRAKERLVRGALDDAVHLTESDPQTAALKNLLFRSLIYHLYIDADVNARLTMLKHIKERVLAYKKFFGPLGLGVDDEASPVLGNLDQVYSSVQDLIGLPTSVFYAQDADDAPEAAYRSFREVIQEFGDHIGRVNDYYRRGDEEIVSAVQKWIDRLSKSRTVSRIDSAQAWGNDVSSHIDRETLNLEAKLNATLWERNEFIIDFVEKRHLPNVDTAGVTAYLTDLAELTAGSADSAVHNYLDLSRTVFGSIRDLFGKGVVDPNSYLDAANTLANSGVTAATSVWRLYTKAFDRQLDLARSLGAEIPDLPDKTFDYFDRLGRVLGYVPSYFLDL